MATPARGQRQSCASAPSAIDVVAAVVCGGVGLCLIGGCLQANWWFGANVLGVSPGGKLISASAMANIAALKFLLPLCWREAWRHGRRFLALQAAVFWVGATMLSLVAWLAALDFESPQFVSAADVVAHILETPADHIEPWLLLYCAASLELVSGLSIGIALGRLRAGRSCLQQKEAVSSLPTADGYRPRTFQLKRLVHADALHPTAGTKPLREPARQWAGPASAVSRRRRSAMATSRFGTRSEHSIGIVRVLGEATDLLSWPRLHRYGGYWPRAP